MAGWIIEIIMCGVMGICAGGEPPVIEDLGCVSRVKTVEECGPYPEWPEL